MAPSAYFRPDRCYLELGAGALSPVQVCTLGQPTSLSAISLLEWARKLIVFLDNRIVVVGGGGGGGQVLFWCLQLCRVQPEQLD